MSDLFADQTEPLPPPARRVGLLVCGPHASGKTTAVREAIAGHARDRRVLFVDQDKYGMRPMNEIREKLHREWSGNETVVIVAGTARAMAGVADVVKLVPEWRTLEIAMTSMEPDVMREHLVRRCALTNKRFRADYWTERTLKYDGQVRFEASYTKRLPGTPVRRFPIGLGYTGHAELVLFVRDFIEEALR